MTRGLLVLAATAVLPSCGQRPPAAPERLGAIAEWKVVGPGGGGALLDPAFSPHDSRLLVVSTDMTGCYVSEDGGVSWSGRLFRFPCRFSFDPRDAKVIYAAAGPAGLYRSANRGRSWELILPRPEAVRELSYEGDESAPVLLDERGRAHPWVYGLATQAGRTWAVWGTALMVTPDGGRHWEKATDLPQTAWRLWAETAGAEVYLQLRESMAVWDGKRLEVLTAPAKGRPLTDLAVSFVGPGQPPVVWAVQEDRPGGVWQSADGGRSWRAAAPFSEAVFRAVGVAGQTVYLSYIRPGEAGVAGSRDGGRSWSPLWTDRGSRPSPNISDPWLNQTKGPDFGEHPRTLHVAQHDDRLVLSGDFGRVMKSLDGGATWVGVYARQFEDGSFATNGLDVLTCYGVHWDPFRPNRLFVSYSDIGLMRSENGGGSWQASQAGIPRAWNNTSYWVEFDPAVRDRMWSAQSGTHDLPRARMFRQRQLRQLGRGGIVRSEDGGRTWRPSSVGLPDAPAVHLLLDRSSPATGRRLWAVLPGHGVWRTSDGGGNWEPDNEGLDLDNYPLTWRLHADAAGSLYVVVYGCDELHGRPGGQGALYRRTQGASRWSPVPLPERVTAPTDIVSDPHDVLRLYLTAWSAEQVGRPAPGAGVWRSDNGGATWSRVLEGDRHVASVTLDARHPGRVYAASYETALWRSDDGGNHWYRLPGFQFKHAQRILIDPWEPERIWVTTFGSSVWVGPAAGSSRIAGEAATDPLSLYVRRVATAGTGRQR